MNKIIAQRGTTIYKPVKPKYGKQVKPSRKDTTRGASKKRTPSSSVDWRDSNDYRKQYFEKNHGIGGYGYVCSQCWKPMFKKEKIQVDHIIPPSRFAVEKKKKGKHVKTSVMARFLNNSFNCAAICPDCNRRKSNKIDSRVLHGYAMKSVEVAYAVSQFLVSIPFMAVATGMWLTRKTVVSAAGLVGAGGKGKGSRKR